MHLFLELRFSVISFPFLNNGMSMAGEIAESYARLETNGITTRFNVPDDDVIFIDPGRLGIELHGEDANGPAAVKRMKWVVSAWKKHIGDLPKLGRVGFRVQAIEPHEGSRTQLIEVLSKSLFSARYYERYDRADFAITAEEIEGVEGYRSFLGAMHHDELMEKWKPKVEPSPRAPSYLTLDVDFGTAKAQGTAYETFVLGKWAEIGETMKWFSEPARAYEH
jgi:hypothetical protein